MAVEFKVDWSRDRRGYSAQCVASARGTSVSLGLGNTVSDRRPMAIVQTDVGGVCVSVVGGEKFAAEVAKIADKTGVHLVVAARNLVLRRMRPRMVRELVAAAFADGVAFGEEKVRRSIRELLGVG